MSGLAWRVSRVAALAVFFSADALSVRADDVHVVEINRTVGSPDEGLLLGNGDLSCSVYQTADDLVFRLGKGDVWDRRLDLEGAAKPVTVREYIDGVLRAGWRTEDWSGTRTVASVTNDPQRFSEAFGGAMKPLSHPYPMPKPTGELRMRLPMDLPGPMEISQRLLVEEGRVFVDCRWTNGVQLKVEALIPYGENVLAVRWAMKGWDDWTRVGNDSRYTPIRFALTRWADPTYASWSAAMHAEHGLTSNEAMARACRDAETLPLPSAFLNGTTGCIEQRFHRDNLFPEGFVCRMTLSSGSCGVSVPDVAYGSPDAWIVATPHASLLSGSLAVAVTTSRDDSLAAAPARPFADYRRATVEPARADWSRRGLSFPSDRALENLWYATCHARRCLLKGGTVPPGLFYPSTLGDYTYWNGDYHSNYNMESIYWGAFTVNQLDQMEAYFDCVDLYRPIGEKIAEKYYGCRGCFIQLEGLPLRADDDFHGYLPLGRMVYMTGWLMEPYWRWYRYTLDKNWLEKRGYPFIKDCALFYLDFLKKAPHEDLPSELKDGKYHVFPSVAGESGWTKPMDLCDCAQGVGHVRFCLHAAILASKELGVDADLRDAWQERLDNLVGRPTFSGSDAAYQEHCWLNAEPELGGSVPKPIPPWDGRVRCPENGNGFSSQDYWYAGHSMMYGCSAMRNGTHVPERDFPFWRKRVDKWTTPNGLVRAMALKHYARVGAWTEALSVMSPFEESLLQSWDGSIRLFPNWRGPDVSFTRWRAEGAFLVSAEWKDGRVASVLIESEKGAPCVLSGDWLVADGEGAARETGRDEFGRLRFETVPGGVYRVTPVPPPPRKAVEVANAARAVVAADETLVAVTQAQPDGYPTSVGEPSFWLDCAETNGWRFAAGSDSVERIPSRGGSKTAGVRHLSTSSEGGDWTGWGGQKLLPPRFVTGVPELCGGAMLDFGAPGSRQGLMFDPDPETADADHPGGYNAMTNIGTVVTVWGSANRGGHFLGGGAKLDFGWHRGQGFRTGSSFDFASTLVNVNAQRTVQNGTARFEGFRSSPLLLGMNGGWQTLSVACERADAQANGLGIADKRAAMSWVSGGQQVAEMLVYDRVLTDAEIALVEMYLERKWFGRGRPGWAGDARLGELCAPGNGMTVPVEVPAGETLEIGFVAGGSQPGAAIVKSGGGALAFAGEGAGRYAGEIVLDGGSLAFPAVADIPSAEGLPHHLYARFDASAGGSVEADEDGFVSSWSNLVADAKTCGRRPDGVLLPPQSFRLRAPTHAARPRLVPDAFGAGRPALDFGLVKRRADGGRCLHVCSNQTCAAHAVCGCAIELRGIGTVVAALEPLDGGGNLVDMRAMQRQPASTTSPHAPTMYHAVSGVSAVTGRDGESWMDGLKWPPSDGYRLAGPQVAAFRIVGGNLSRVMCDADGTWCGGSRVAELLVWDRALTEDEIRRASAYLAAKWFRRPVPGYRRPEGAFAADDVQRLVVNAAAEINVGSGRTVRVAHLAANADVVKTGAGVLELVDASFVPGAGVSAREGSISYVLPREGGDAPAGGATMHLDATDPSSMVLATGSLGEKTLVRWNDAERGVGLWSYSPARRPYLNETPAAACNGLPVVDFGGFGSAAVGVGDAGGGRWMAFDRTLYSIRSVYMVVGFQRGGGFLFSNSEAAPLNGRDDITFHAGFKTIGGKTVYSGAAGLFQGYGVQDVFKGGIFTNGVAVGSLTAPMPTDGYFLLELHPSSGAQAAQIARDRNIGDRIGGFRVGELLLYERELSDAERLATRNYLLRKWFGRDAPAPAFAAKMRGVDVVGSACVTIDADQGMAHVAGEGRFSKSGAGTLAVDDLSDFSGKVAVSGGVLRVNGSDPAVEPELVTAGLVYHADATRGIVATTNGQGVVCVDEWASQAGGGLTAVRDGGSRDMQRLVEDPDVGYRPTVDMNGYNACFRWQNAEWDWANVPGIRSVFWVVGSQNGGGFLLGGGRNAAGELTYFWHRGIFYPVPGKTIPNCVGTTNVCNLLHGAADRRLLAANWWMNGESVSPMSTGLSGRWDQVTMIVADDASAVNADGFAFDGRSRKDTGATNHEYNGHQRLAEVLVYDRRVTEEERVRIESYLRSKWLLGMHRPADGVDLEIASGATLELGGPQRYRSLTGGGTVNGDLTLRKLVVDAAATECPTVNGTLTLTPSLELEVLNRSARPSGGRVRILTCADIRGVGQSSDLDVIGDGLYLTLPKRSFLLMIR